MEDIKKLTIEQVEFALNEGKEKFISSSKSIEVLEKKAFFIITVLIGLITFLAKVLFDNLDKLKWDIVIPIGTLTLGFIFSLYNLIVAIKTKKFHSIGNNPSVLLSKKYSKYGYKYLVACEALSYDNRIKHNNGINSERGKLIDKSINIIFISFMLSILIRILIESYTPINLLFRLAHLG